MEPVYTRKFLQNHKIDNVMREAAIRDSVRMVTAFIMRGSCDFPTPRTDKWKMVGHCKLMVPDKTLKSNISARNPIDYSVKEYPDIIPDVIEKLRTSFPDVDFRQDELGTYLLVDWS